AHRVAAPDRRRHGGDPLGQGLGDGADVGRGARQAALPARPAPGEGPRRVRGGAPAAARIRRRAKAMIDDALVFDCVAHVFNFSEENAFGKAGLMFDQHLYAFHQALTPAGQTVLTPEQFLREWSVEEIDRMVFEESDTDMLIAMPLPL